VYALSAESASDDNHNNGRDTDDDVNMTSMTSVWRQWLRVVDVRAALNAHWVVRATWQLGPATSAHQHHHHQHHHHHHHYDVITCIKSLLSPSSTTQSHSSSQTHITVVQWTQRLQFHQQAINRLFTSQQRTMKRVAKTTDTKRNNYRMLLCNLTQ